MRGRVKEMVKILAPFVGIVPRNRDSSSSRLPRIIASDSTLSFWFVFLVLADLRLKPVWKRTMSKVSGIYIWSTSRSQESRITCSNVHYSMEAFGQIPNSSDSDALMLIRESSNNVTHNVIIPYIPDLFY